MLTAPQFSPDRLSAVLARIAAAARRAGRDPSGVRLLAVSKQQPAAVVRAAAEAGQTEFGENYVQEALAKIEALRDLPLTWHFIGRLQANKTRDVACACQWVHALDRPRIAERLSAQRPHHAGPLDVLLQVKLTDEPGKGGITPGEAPALAEVVAGLPRLRLRGLMCMPGPAGGEDAQRAPFRRLHELLQDLRGRGHALDTLSMGMSDDLEAAIAEGATIVRVGTAVFGPRT
jgi:pyridoxal phosphate enzyme (YggS family)